MKSTKPGMTRLPGEMQRKCLKNTTMSLNLQNEKAQGYWSDREVELCNDPGYGAYGLGAHHQMALRGQDPRITLPRALLSGGDATRGPP